MLASRAHRRLRGVSDLGGYRRCSLLERGKKDIFETGAPLKVRTRFRMETEDGVPACYRW